MQEVENGNMTPEQARAAISAWPKDSPESSEKKSSG
jgi:hypothetical protein